MSGESQSCLRFTLEESVWFQRGQEVGELLSISLDPDITIQENDQYVTIKGSLMLTGEYQCDPFKGETGDSPPGPVRTIQSVTESQTGSLEFFHRFPVDISIPKNRIASIYDIDIKVDSFDYDFPEGGSLKLSAELAITGLYGDQQHGSDLLENTSAAPPESVKEEGYEPYEQVDLEPLYRETEQLFQEHPPYAPLAFEQEGTWEEEEEEETADVTFSAEARREPKEASQVLSKDTPHIPEGGQQFNVQEEYGLSMSRDEMAGTPVMPKQPAEMGGQEEVLADESQAASKQEEQASEPVGMGAEESSGHPHDEEAPKKKTGKKGLSIAEFLARKEETNLTKIKVCIVQQEDTLQEIAERYDVSVQQLLHVNRLGIDQDVEEGQVLYVPAIPQLKGGS